MKKLKDFYKDALKEVNFAIFISSILFIGFTIVSMLVALGRSLEEELHSSFWNDFGIGIIFSFGTAFIIGIVIFLINSYDE